MQRPTQWWYQGVNTKPLGAGDQRMAMVAVTHRGDQHRKQLIRDTRQSGIRTSVQNGPRELRDSLCFVRQRLRASLSVRLRVSLRDRDEGGKQAQLWRVCCVARKTP